MSLMLKGLEKNVSRNWKGNDSSASTSIAFLKVPISYLQGCSKKATTTEMKKTKHRFGRPYASITEMHGKADISY